MDTFPALQALILEALEPARIARPVQICIGTFWTFVSIEVNGSVKAGIAATGTQNRGDHHYGGRFPVAKSGQLLQQSVPDLITLALSESELEASIGFSAINALLAPESSVFSEINASEIILEKGLGKKVAFVGHFPFSVQLRDIAREIWILELHPREGDLPASRAPEILPEADVVAITGVSLLNHTFDSLIKYCRNEAFVIVLGGTTPLSHSLFAFGVDALSGTQIIDPPAALRSIQEGATFKQIAGKRLITLFNQA